MCDSTTADRPRTAVRDAVLAGVSENIETHDELLAVEWAATETVDAVALGLRNADLGDFYEGGQLRRTAL